jgi:hypothetical protein
VLRSKVVSDILCVFRTASLGSDAVRRIARPTHENDRTGAHNEGVIGDRLMQRQV